MTFDIVFLADIHIPLSLMLQTEMRLLGIAGFTVLLVLSFLLFNSQREMYEKWKV